MPNTFTVYGIRFICTLDRKCVKKNWTEYLQRQQMLATLRNQRKEKKCLRNTGPSATRNIYEIRNLPLANREPTKQKYTHV